ncbi:hypothetical protein F383_28582 [Gossypium arboreum]|uniref:Uncharacterized protein n=1 Tax=Gossypium arboreum TaxID=29729 RepID=A0A0B0MUK7_GOSAR|nr:hypothetical protein F383_28582 [Gossypium arboreum]
MKHCMVSRCVGWIRVSVRVRFMLIGVRLGSDR